MRQGEYEGADEALEALYLLAGTASIPRACVQLRQASEEPRVQSRYGVLRETDRCALPCVRQQGGDASV
ncbi:Uncharacterised protein [Chlamydia trachomatis]|nr:Uncharacterised protein [Chlamydia trachomatis]